MAAEFRGNTVMMSVALAACGKRAVKGVAVERFAIQQLRHIHPVEPRNLERRPRRDRAFRGRPPAAVSVLSTNQNIQVEAGTFSCIFYHFEFDSLGYTDFYIAPEIGIIKNEVFEQRINNTPFKRLEERLLSYHLN
jgi:hypothetical protein